MTLVSPIKNTLQPYVTGSSIVAIKYSDGILVAADCKASYGRISRYRDISRIFNARNVALVASSGEYSDFQKITEHITSIIDHDWSETGGSLNSFEIATYISRWKYNRRCNLNPLLLTSVVAGISGHTKTLVSIDSHGLLVDRDWIATGFGTYMCSGILEHGYRQEASLEEAKLLVKTCMKTLWYRDTFGSEKIQLAYVNTTGITIEEPIILDSSWNYSSFVSPTTIAGTYGCTW